MPIEFWIIYFDTQSICCDSLDSSVPQILYLWIFNSMSDSCFFDIYSEDDYAYELIKFYIVLCNYWFNKIKIIDLIREFGKN